MPTPKSPRERPGSSGFAEEVLLEGDALRLVPRAEALKFWRDWLRK